MRDNAIYSPAVNWPAVSRRWRRPDSSLHGLDSSVRARMPIPLTVPSIARITVSFAFLGVAYLAGALTHSSTVFVAVMGVGLVVGLVLRLAR